MKAIHATVAAILLFALPGFGQSIKTDYDREFDLSALKTFGFADQTRDAKDALAGNDIVDRRIRSAIDEQLKKAGFQTAEKADFLIAYYASVDQKKNIYTTGYGRPRWYGSQQVWIDEYTEGTVMVDFLESANGQLVWRATATRTVDPQKSEKNIRKGAEKLVKQFVKDIKDQQKAKAKNK